MEIKKDMNIMEIIQNHPDTVEVFLEAGIHCFGCAAANFETLEQGLMAHGMEEKQIEKFVEDLNKMANSDE